MHSRILGAGHAPTSFHDIVVPLLDQAYSFARFLSGDADGAQEIVHDAFLRARGDYDGYRGGDCRAWLFRIVRNCYHDWLTARRRISRRTAACGRNDNGRLAAQNLSAGEKAPESGSETFRLAIGKMPRPLREMIILRELEAFSYRQIVEVTSLPITTIMSRLARARTKLRSARRGNAESVSAALVAAARETASASPDSSQSA
jgi:RNA polymerase sigma-70 factor (ECF subfamily)